MTTKTIDPFICNQLKAIFVNGFDMDAGTVFQSSKKDKITGKLSAEGLTFNINGDNDSIIVSIEIEKINFGNINEKTLEDNSNKKLELKKLHNIIPQEYLSGLSFFEHHFNQENKYNAGIQLYISLSINQKPVFQIDIYFLNITVDLLFEIKDDQIFVDCLYGDNFYTANTKINDPEADVLNIINKAFDINLNHSKIDKDLMFSDVIEDIKSNLKVIEILEY